MILVTLGTQDKDFSRLLKLLDKEIEKGNIKDKVIVQSGHTKYKSDNMEIFDFVGNRKLEQLVKDSKLIITHGGVGSILSALKNNKKVIAAPRLAKYKEHHNDHQKQIVKEFANRGYILELKDFNKFEKVYEKSKNFRPKKYTPNTKNMVKLIDDYITEDNHKSWFNKIKLNIILWILLMILEVFVLSILLDKLIVYKILSKIISTIIVLIINYIFYKNNK